MLKEVSNNTNEEQEEGAALLDSHRALMHDLLDACIDKSEQGVDIWFEFTPHVKWVQWRGRDGKSTQISYDPQWRDETELLLLRSIVDVSKAKDEDFDEDEKDEVQDDD